MDKHVPKPAGVLLDLIGDTEAPKGYNTVYGNNQNKLTKPVTSMTLDELLNNQVSFTKRFGSSASGRYQFMRGTLMGLKSELKLRGSQVFDPNLQDRLAYHLLRKRGYDKWIDRTYSDGQFMVGLAKEWASFPVPYTVKGAHRNVLRGQSYYAGDGMNKALVGVSKVEATLAVARQFLLIPPVPAVPDVPAMPPPTVEVSEAPQKPAGFWATLVAALETVAQEFYKTA